MNREKLARQLAPLSPPCFSSRQSFLEYVSAAAVSQAADHAPGPLRFEAGQPVTFDHRFSFCCDCSLAFRSAMLKADRCDPSYLRKQQRREPLRFVVAIPVKVSSS